MKRMTEHYNVVHLSIKDAFYYNDVFPNAILLKPIPNTVYYIDDLDKIGESDRYDIFYGNSMEDNVLRFMYQPDAPQGLEYTQGSRPCYTVLYKDSTSDNRIAVLSMVSCAIVFYPRDNQ